MKDLILKQSRNYEIDGTGRKFKTPVEERVKKIVARQLKVDETEITTESNFVRDLGAESIQSIELVAAFGVNI